MTDTVTLTRSGDGTHYVDPDGGKWLLIKPDAWDLLQARLAAIRKAAAEGLPQVRAAMGLDGEIPFAELEQ